MVRWDGVVEPQRREELVSSIDIVPTLLAAAEVETSEELPGIDLVQVLKGNTLQSDRAVFGGIYPGDATSLGHPERDIAYRWVRKGDHKLIVPNGADAWGDYLKADALFDVANDPGEKTNLIGEVSMAATASQLRELLESWWPYDSQE